MAKDESYGDAVLGTNPGYNAGADKIVWVTWASMIRANEDPEYHELAEGLRRQRILWWSSTCSIR